jgi:hypothetical protein
MVKITRKANRFDRRAELVPPEGALRKIFDSVASRPLVNAFDLEEMGPVFDALPEFKFPITSAGHLLDQLATAEMVVHGIALSASRLIKYMPAYYFPIVSHDNLIEKIGEVMRANRPPVDPGEVAAIRRQLPPLRYPIKSGAELVQVLGEERAYRFQGGKVNVRAAVQQIPEKLFPILSDADLDMKLRYLVNRRPLIVGHQAVFERP